MREEKIVYPNDTTRQIDRMIDELNKWKVNNPLVNIRETSLVITKLEEASMWSLKMVKNEN